MAKSNSDTTALLSSIQLPTISIAILITIKVMSLKKIV